jgi:integrase
MPLLAGPFREIDVRSLADALAARTIPRSRSAMPFARRSRPPEFRFRKKVRTSKGYSAHGLRKASATIAAESGATESELNAMFGWSGYQMAQLYTKKADRKRLAVRALAKWTRPSSDDVVEQAGVAHLHLEKERA